MTSRDITARKRTEQFVLNHISEGVCLVSAATSEIVFANAALEMMLGYAGELEGMPATTIGLRTASLGGADRAGEGARMTKDGRPLWCRTTTSHLDHPEYGPVWLVMMADITEKRTTEALIARLASIVESTNDAIMSKSLTGIIETWNAGAERLYGYAAEEVVGLAASTLVPVELEAEERELLERVARGDRVEALETMRIHKNGQRIDVSLTASPIREPGGAITGISTIARDISQRKRDERLLQASVREKSVLLKEVHHRVKNNLQVVSSLLKLHAEQVTDPAALTAFQDSQTRVRSIALLHEMLYRSKDLGAVDVAEYAEALINALRHTHSERAVAFTVDAQGVLLPMDEAVPFGLILNELVTNSLKHAFGSGVVAPPHVDIVVRSADDGLELLVRDNGVGFPPQFEAHAAKSLGMHLVLALSGQLGGEIDFRSTECGAEARLSFPTPEAGGD